MLLTCNSCRNTYVIDDAALQASGGVAQCEQCQEPLVPLNAGGTKDSTTILDGYSFENLEAQWRKNQLAGGPDAPPPGAYPQPPAQVAPTYDAYPPATAPAPPASPVWPSAPPPRAPLPTQALTVPTQAPDGAPPSDLYIAPSERTMAIDVDTMVRDVEQAGAAPRRADPPSPQQGGKGAVNTGRLDKRQVEAQRQQVIVGAGSAQHAEKTAAIDASGVDAFMSGQAPGPSASGAQFTAAQQPRPRVVPGRGPVAQPQVPQAGGGKGLVIGIVALFSLLLVAGVIIVIVLFVLADDKKSTTRSADDPEETQLTFPERVDQARSAPSALMLPPVNGVIAEQGVIVTVSTMEGVYVESNLAVPYTDGRPAPQHVEGNVPYLTELAQVLSATDSELPIVLLFDQSLTMAGVFPVVFTAVATGRQVYVGGDSLLNPGMVSILLLQPHGWPAPPTGAFQPAEDTDLRVAIEGNGITVSGKDVNPGGVKKNEVRILKLAGTYDLSNLTKALAAAKSATPGLKAVRFAPGAELGFGTFIEVVQNVRGEDFNFPRFRVLLLEPPR